MKKKEKEEKGEKMAVGSGFKKKLLGHLKKDDKEFRGQLKDDMKMKKILKKSGKGC